MVWFTDQASGNRTEFYFMSNRFNDNALFGGIIQPCSILPNAMTFAEREEKASRWNFFFEEMKVCFQNKNRGASLVATWSTALYQGRKGANVYREEKTKPTFRALVHRQRRERKIRSDEGPTTQHFQFSLFSLFSLQAFGTPDNLCASFIVTGWEQLRTSRW